MTIEFWIARSAKLIDEVPPHKAIRSVAQHLPEPALTLTSAVSHVLVGSLADALYGIAVPRKCQGLLTGVVTGMIVWVMGYEVVMPAATDIQPAHRDDRSRATVIAGAHVIFGASLGMASLVLQRPSRDLSG